MSTATTTLPEVVHAHQLSITLKGHKRRQVIKSAEVDTAFMQHASLALREYQQTAGWVYRACRQPERLIVRGEHDQPSHYQHHSNHDAIYLEIRS